MIIMRSRSITTSIHSLAISVPICIILYVQVSIRYIAVTMSVLAHSELDPLLTSQDYQQLSCCCKLSYKPRKFSSKGAVLVLVWQFLVFCGVFTGGISAPTSNINNYLLSIGFALLIPTAIISGWLADTKVGRSKVVQTGLSLTWLGLVLETVGTILTLSVHTTSIVINGIVLPVQYIALYTAYYGAAIFFTNVVQFGLEQMPDASSDALTAFISWFSIVTALGEGSYAIMASLFSTNCIDSMYMYVDDHAFRAIIGCVLLSIAMCSKYLFSHWLIDHRQNHNPLKTVYRVLKFAKQHKYPVNRSAFTYCEDEIPSRIDLGKSKYGGPFTTEEVEDVKTFFRIILILTVIFVFTFTVFVITIVPLPSYENHCLTDIIFSFRGFFTAAVFLIYEYILDPFIKIQYRVSTLKRIGLCMLYVVLNSVILFVYATVTEIGLVDLDSIIIKGHHSIEVTVNWLSRVILFIFFRSILQFTYSQAPEHMKGFLLVWAWLAGIVVVVTANGKLLKCPQLKYCGVYLTSVAVAISLLVFVVYCCVARWYKRRERDEPCNERAIIEEIYGRHVEHNSIEQRDSD